MCASSEPPAPRRQLPFVVLVAGIASLAIAVVAWKIFSTLPASDSGSSARPAASSAAPPVGRPAPDFTLPLLSGGTLSLHSFKGKPVLLNFWASWCVPCREETPLLVRLHETYEPRSIVFVGVNVEDNERAARAFLQQYHVDYPVVRSADDGLIDAYAIPGISTTVFIGASGIVIDKFTGGFVGPNGEKALVTPGTFAWDASAVSGDSREIHGAEDTEPVATPPSHAGRVWRARVGVMLPVLALLGLAPLRHQQILAIGATNTIVRSEAISVNPFHLISRKPMWA